MGYGRRMDGTWVECGGKRMKYESKYGGNLVEIRKECGWNMEGTWMEYGCNVHGK